MGAGILATNGPATTDALLGVRRALDDWLVAIETGDASILEERLRAVRDDLAPHGGATGPAGKPG
jgi:hypothetical protein